VPGNSIAAKQFAEKLDSVTSGDIKAPPEKKDFIAALSSAAPPKKRVFQRSVKPK
jgi:hypothetical protein